MAKFTGKCKQCTKEYTAERSTKKFCSRRCNNKYWKSTHKHNAVCKHCGKTYFQERKTRMYCSRECAKADRDILKDIESKCVDCGATMKYKAARGVLRCKECAKIRHREQALVSYHKCKNHRKRGNRKCLI